MKNKILLRLIMYFVTSFVIFAFVIGIVFSTLFHNHNVEMHMAELERQAESIAEIFVQLSRVEIHSIAGVVTTYRIHQSIGGMDFQTFVQSIEQIVQSSVWIVDRELNHITFGQIHMQSGINSGDLPANAELVINNVLRGEGGISGSFSEFLGSPSITAAAPIETNGQIVGAVLLHSYISDMDNVTSTGLNLLLYSMVAAIIISILVAVLFSTRFTKPLSKMKKAAISIGDGDYSAKTGIIQADEIGALALALDEMADKLEYSSKESLKLHKLRQDFVANISHELRTPITVIRGSLEAICDGVVTDTTKIESYNQQMLNETIYLERLVRDLLDLSRLQNLDFGIEMQPINLKDIIKDVLRSMQEIANSKNINLIFTDKGFDFIFVGDYGRIRQMIIIVLDNAIKFSQSDSRVDITILKDEDKAVLTIKDTGCGINPDDLPHIFERFYKERSEQNKIGTGLGLSIAKQIADRHDINISITSQLGKGSEFTAIFKAT